MEKINEKKFEPTLDEPTSNQAIEFQDNFDKTMVRNNINLTEVDEMLNEKEQSLKKKIFSLSKMEALVFSDPKLSAVYDEMAEDGEEKYGYHYNETIMNIIFNDYVLNSSKYLQKYKQAIPKEKKRRDKSGINKIRKDAEEMEKRRAELRKEKSGKKENVKSLSERMNRLNDKIIKESTVANNAGAFETKAGNKSNYEANQIDTDKEWEDLNNPDVSEIAKEQKMKDKGKKKTSIIDDSNLVGGSNAKPTYQGGKIVKNPNNNINESTMDNLEDAKQKAQKISKEEEVVQHVNKTSNDNYEVSDWHDSDNTIISYENGEEFSENNDQVDETTSASSAAGGGSSYVGYAGPIAWGKGELTNDKKSDDNKESFWKGGETIKESNYLIESEGFEKFINELDEEINPDMISTKEDLNSYVKRIKEKTGKGLNKYHIPTLAGDALYTVAIQLADRMLPLPWDQMSDTNSMWDYIDENGGMKYEDFIQAVKEAVNDRLSGEDMGFENLMEHHADTREEKIQYIVKYLKSDDQYGNYQPPINWLNSLDDNVIDTLYKNTEALEFSDAQLNEKAKSKAQQKFMGMVHAYQKGDLKGSDVSNSVKKAAKSMTDKEAEDFASTKHDKLPEKVNEHHLETRGDKLDFILKAGELYFGPEVFDKDLQYKEWSKLPDERIHKLYLNMEKILKQNDIDPTTLNEANESNNEWEGVDADLETSLFEYGFVASQPEEKDYPDEWFIIYKIDDNRFGTGWIREAELNNIVSGNDWANEEDVQKFLSFVGQDFNSWLNSTFINKLSDVINYWGVENIMGTEYSPMDKEEALQKISPEIQENNNSDTYFRDLFSDTMKDVDKTMEYEEAIKKELINKYKYGEDDADTLIANNEKKIDEKRRFGHTSPEIMAKILAHKDGKIYLKDKKVYLSDTNQEIQETLIDDNEDSMKMKQPINVQTNDMPVGMQSSGPMNEEEFEPEEEDCFISSNGFKYSVSCESNFIGDFEEMNDAINAIKTWQIENNYYPNTWFVSDHGNVDLMNINTNDKTNNDMNEEKYLKEINKDLSEMEKQHNNLKNIVEDRKTSSLVNKDRLGSDNEKNFKSDLKHSGTKEIIDTTKELEWKDQQTDVPKDPQKLGKDIEKESLKNTKGDSFENVGNSTNNDGDEIPKRNLTDDESNEVDLYRKGLGDANFDNEPDERYKERMKRDMGEKEYKKREDRMDFEAEKPMYNKDTQPIGDGIEKDQFDKNKSEWNKRTGVSESTLTGKYIDEIGKTRFFDFSTLNVIELNNTKGKPRQTGMSQVFLEGLGNTYNSKVEINEGVGKAINEWNFYTDGENVFAEKKNTTKILKENKEKDGKPQVNEQFDKMKHLLGYNPKDFTNTKNIKL